AMLPYIKGDIIDASVSVGEDLGTSYNDILDVFTEYHCDIPTTKSMEQDQQVLQGIKDYDGLLNAKVDNLLLNDIVTGYGVAFATDEAWHLKNGNAPASVVIQGFGSVGAGCALKLQQLGYQIV